MMNDYSDHPDRGEGEADPNEHQSDAAELPAEKTVPTWINTPNCCGYCPNW